MSLVTGSVCLVQGTYCQSFSSHIIYVHGSAELLRRIDCSYKERQCVDSRLHMPSLSLSACLSEFVLGVDSAGMCCEWMWSAGHLQELSCKASRTAAAARATVVL